MFDFYFSLACRCSAKAKRKGYTYFSIRYWAECWAGKDHRELDNLIKDKSQRSNQCADPSFHTCKDAAEHECAGKANTDYMFSLFDVAHETESMQYFYRN